MKNIIGYNNQDEYTSLNIYIYIYHNWQYGNSDRNKIWSFVVYYRQERRMQLVYSFWCGKWNWHAEINFWLILFCLLHTNDLWIGMNSLSCSYGLNSRTDCVLLPWAASLEEKPNQFEKEWTPTFALDTPLLLKL